MGILGKNFVYNGQNTSLRVEQICEVLRYYRVIGAIERQLKMSSREDLSGQVAEKFKNPPDFWTLVVTSPDRLLWSICNDLAVGVFDDYETVSPADREDARGVLMQIIMQYNKKYNPGFKDFDQAEVKSDNPSISPWTTVFIPTKNYIETEYSRLQKEEENNSPLGESLDKMPKEIPLYVNDPKRILEKKGNKILENKDRYNGDIQAKRREKGLITPRFGPYKRGRYIQRLETKYIILHSLNSDKVSGSIEDGAAHYIVDRNGEITYAVDRRYAHNHCGAKFQRTKAMWNGDENIAMKSIGIEVAGEPGGGWTDKQYKAVRRLIHWLGAEYGVQAKNVLTHRQVAYSEYGRGRKGDPYGLDWSRLGLPDNSSLVDMDVATGRVKSNLDAIRIEMKGKVPVEPKAKGKKGKKRNKGGTRVGSWHGNKESDLAGLIYAVKLRKTLNKPTSQPAIPKNLNTSNKTNTKQKNNTSNKTPSKIPKKTETYTVRKGDTLFKIAGRYKLSVKDLMRLNRLETDTIHPGQKIKVPKG